VSDCGLCFQEVPDGTGFEFTDVKEKDGVLIDSHSNSTSSDCLDVEVIGCVVLQTGVHFGNTFWVSDAVFAMDWKIPVDCHSSWTSSACLDVDGIGCVASWTDVDFSDVSIFADAEFNADWDGPQDCQINWMSSACFDVDEIVCVASCPVVDVGAASW
jgi:hypothetical protein